MEISRDWATVISHQPSELGMLMIVVKSVSCLGSYKLNITLSNGIAGVFDVSPYLAFGVFSELKNLGYFQQVRVNFCGIEWPNGQDFSADTISHDLTRHPSHHQQI